MSRQSTLLITRRLPPATEARAEANYKICRWDRRGPALAEAAAGADALLCTPADRLDAAVIAALPDQVRVIGTFSVGFEHIDVAAARARGIAVVNTPRRAVGGDCRIHDAADPRRGPAHRRGRAAGARRPVAGLVAGDISGHPGQRQTAGYFRHGGE